MEVCTWTSCFNTLGCSHNGEFGRGQRRRERTVVKDEVGNPD